MKSSNMEYTLKAAKATLYVLCFVLLMLCITHFSVLEPHSPASLSSCPVPDYIFGARAAPPEDEPTTSESSPITPTNSTVMDTSTNSTASGETADDVFEADTDCTTVPPFPDDMFKAQSNVSAVYLEPSKIPKGMFSEIGFEKFVTIFGVQIIATANITDEQLGHVARIFARYIDNDQDGVPERPRAIEKIREYHTIIGYLSGPEESETLWVDKFRDAKHESFRNMFLCQMHFFEQWANDASKEYHTLRNAEQNGANTTAVEKCGALQSTNFDWPLWYFEFTITYYGYLEDFDNSTIALIESVLNRAKQRKMFNGNYPDDREMEIADFFAWSMLTRLKALECHCKEEIISEVWQLCTPADLNKLDPAWAKFLDELPGMPKVLPDGTYNSSAVAKPAS